MINENLLKKYDKKCTLIHSLSSDVYYAKYVEITGYDYNINKTNSIVSPYIASVNISGNYCEKEGITEDECLNKNWSLLENIGLFIELRYAYQDGEWILTKRLSSEKLE